MDGYEPEYNDLAEIVNDYLSSDPDHYTIQDYVDIKNDCIKELLFLNRVMGFDMHSLEHNDLVYSLSCRLITIFNVDVLLSISIASGLLAPMIAECNLATMQAIHGFSAMMYQDLLSGGA